MRPVGGRARRFALTYGAPIISVAIECSATHYDNPSAVRGLGLISVTPWFIFVLAFVLSASFACMLRASELNQRSLLAHVLALALLLPGLPGFLEQFPRFGTAWLHAGFIQAIIIHKHPIVGIDARFSWPGFFTGMAAVVGMAHLGNALPLLRWTPLAFNLAYALPIFIIARALLRSNARAWLVVWLFILTNWVGQDYFSPQGMGYFIFLSCLAILLVGFHRSGRPVADRWIRGLITRFGSPDRPDTLAPTAAQQIGLLTVATLAVVALAMEHQLTPVVLGVDVVALALARQIRARYFAVAVVLSVLFWISYGATAFWQGHFYSTIFGGGGTSAVQSTVTNRIAGSVAHEAVVYERLLFALGLWGVAGIATLRAAFRRTPVPLSALVPALVPFVVVVAQSYGGEAALRIYLYTLPFMLILAVAGMADRFPRRKLTSAAVLAVLSTVIVPFLLIARFGNEQFEQVTAGDVGAARWFYSAVRPGASVESVAPNVLLGYQGLAAYTYGPRDVNGDYVFDTTRQVLKHLGHNRRGTYVIVTPAQVEYAVVNDGAKPDWARLLEARLAKDHRFKLLYNRFGGRVYKVDGNR